MSSTVRTVLLSAITSLLVSATVAAGAVTVLQRDAAPRPTADTPSYGERAREDDDASSPIVQAVRQAEPAVVSVIISKDLPVLERYFETVPSPFGDFNMRVPRVRQRGTERQQVGGGTAFFVSADGLLMTNKHVVSDPEAAYSVLLNDGRTLDATVLDTDAFNDIALLKVEGNDFPFLSLAQHDRPDLGQTVVAIGNALAEFRNTVSVGVISGLQRSIMAGNAASGTTEQLNSILQTDAAINEGNSGGPLINLDGDVLGMNTAVAAGAQNIGFAIPVDELARVLNSYRQYGRIVHPYIGVRYIVNSPSLQEELSLPTDAGVLLSSGVNEEEPAILPGSPAEKAGLREGDIIMRAAGQNIGTTQSLGDIIQSMAPGETIDITILRDGEEMMVTLTVEEWRE